MPVMSAAPKYREGMMKCDGGLSSGLYREIWFG